MGCPSCLGTKICEGIENRDPVIIIFVIMVLLIVLCAAVAVFFMVFKA